MRKTEEKEFKNGDESIKVLHTFLQPRAALKLGARLMRLVAPLLTAMDVEDVKIDKEMVTKAMPLAFATLDDDVIDELLLKVLNTSTVIRDADGKPSRTDCVDLGKIDKAFDNAMPVMIEVAQWIVGANLANFSFGTVQKGSEPST